jgi:hypothetical protein
MEINLTFESNDKTFYIGDQYSGETYRGPYEVTPKVNLIQTLSTKAKVLTNNVTIKEIPYYETSNKSGLTAIIGG